VDPLDLPSNLKREAKEWVKANVPTSMWRWLKRTTGQKASRVLHTTAELDATLAEAQRAFDRSEEEGQRFCEGFRFEPPAPLPRDPHSADYRAAQLELYRQISGRPSYAVENEHSQANLAAALQRPFPFSTGSSTVAGDYFIAIGFLLKVLKLAPGARVLELGAGWGQTTEMFLKLGCDVTAVEVDPVFVELIRTRCGAHADRLQVVASDMLAYRSERPFDAVVFFEAFHHCADHLAMLRNLEHLVAPGGQVAFASEPISDFPFPWGVRLDGAELYVMRRYGWLELGFESGYFMSTLKQLGWRAERQRSHSISAMTDVIVARR
jgi:2-polyprenyl-3-methyl-5-hydroxy-6-metoxy-1,4-benzoquinol methylase